MGLRIPVLRSRNPEGVAQEMWAMFVVHQKAGDFPGSKDKPSVVHVTRRIQLHYLTPRLPT